MVRSPAGDRTLFDRLARARTTDPGTSHAAARSVRNQDLLRDLVLRALRQYGPQRDDQLVGVINANGRYSPSGVRTRRDELVAAGLVRDTGRRERMPSGRAAIVWEAVG